eukprot:TRINITY_DN1490_c0_g1_i1.p1 TRINITY_DN1490_c0_g1~~TRINITY_DN1490_c0_g1_i1.p1  ORF type:complete len:434 (-),score=66.26 TRINITY_DN1490_c0_g1_i1:87-1388(-)
MQAYFNNPALIQMSMQLIQQQGGFGTLLGQIGQQQQQSGAQQQNPMGGQPQQQQQQQQPQAQQPQINLNAMGGMGGFLPQQNLPPEEKYKDQLKQMEEMGFTNKEVNLEALNVTHGNVQIAVVSTQSTWDLKQRQFIQIQFAQKIMADNTITINLKQGSEKTFQVTISTSSTVLQLKEKCESITNVAPSLQKLIFKGKILNDSDSLSILNIQEGMVIRLIVSKPKQPQPSQQQSAQQQQLAQQQPPSSQPQPNLLGGQGVNDEQQATISSPQAQQMIQQKMQQLVQSTPMLQMLAQELQSNPQMQAYFNNPALIQMSMQLIQQQGGFGTLLGQIGQQQQQSGAQQQNPMGGQPQQQQQQQQPQAQQPQINLNAMGGMGGFLPQQNLPPEEKYKDQLKQMEEMGFTNKEVNLEALNVTHGNVQIAVERILDMLG